MKKLLYVSFENAKNVASGVNKKIANQMNVFHEEGYAVTLVAIYDNTIAMFDHHFTCQMVEEKKGNTRIQLCEWVKQHATDFDIAYVRFQFFCPFVVDMLRKLKQHHCVVLMEIPTYPYENELKSQGARGIPKRLSDSMFRHLGVRYIDRFVAPAYEGNILGKPCITIKNGIDTSKIRARNVRKKDDEIHLIAVAMMAPWHGYDRVIEGLKNYYERKNTRNIIFYLVGEGVETAKYKQLVSEYNLKDHVVFCGRQSGQLLDTLYDNSDIGVSTLGFHRSGLTTMNTLKGIEYMAKGLPIVFEEGEYGMSSSISYEFMVPNCDEAVDISKLVTFYDDLTSKNDTEQLAKQIRLDCVHNWDMHTAMKGVLQYAAQQGYKRTK